MKTPLLLLLLIGFTHATEFADLTAYPVSRIVDGDTVELLINGAPVKVRLIGVDTPETVHPFKPVERYGKEASVFTRNLLRGESVYLKYDKKKIDRYGRTLGYIYRVPDGLFVNAEIVRQGYGHAYVQYPFEHMDLFVALQLRAREAHKGLWADSVIRGATKPVINSKTARGPPSHNNETVYITKSGKKYHHDGCRYLAKSRMPISFQEAKKRYKPCSVCFKDYSEK